MHVVRSSGNAFPSSSSCLFLSAAYSQSTSLNLKCRARLARVCLVLARLTSEVQPHADRRTAQARYTPLLTIGTPLRPELNPRWSSFIKPAEGLVMTVKPGRICAGQERSLIGCGRRALAVA